MTSIKNLFLLLLVLSCYGRFSIISAVSSSTLLDETRLNWYTTPTIVNSTLHNYSNYNTLFSFGNISLSEQLEHEYINLMIEHDIIEPQYVLDISALSDVPIEYCQNIEIHQLEYGYPNNTNIQNTNNIQNYTIIPFYKRQFGLRPSCIIQINFLRTLIPTKRFLQNRDQVQYPQSNENNHYNDRQTQSTVISKPKIVIPTPLSVSSLSNFRTLYDGTVDCLQYKNCTSCVNNNDFSNNQKSEKCIWCPFANECRYVGNSCVQQVNQANQCFIDYKSYSSYYPFLSGTAISSNPYQPFKLATKPCLFINNNTNITIDTNEIYNTTTCKYSTLKESNITKLTNDLLRRSNAAVLVHHAKEGKSAICMIGGTYSAEPYCPSLKSNSTNNAICSFNGIDWYEQTPLPMNCPSPIAVSHKGTLYVTGCLSTLNILNSTIWYATIISYNNNDDTNNNGTWYISQWNILSNLPSSFKFGNEDNCLSSLVLGASHYTHTNDIPDNPTLIIGASMYNLDGLFDRNWYTFHIDNNNNNNVTWKLLHIDSDIDYNGIQWFGIGYLQYFRSCPSNLGFSNSIYCYGTNEINLSPPSVVPNPGKTTDQSYLSMYQRPSTIVNISTPTSNANIYERKPLSTAQRFLLYDQSTFIHVNTSIPTKNNPFAFPFYDDQFLYPIPSITQTLPWKVENTLSFSPLLDTIIIRNRLLIWPDELNEPSIIYYRTKEIYTGYLTPCQSCNSDNSVLNDNQTTWYGCNINPFKPVCPLCKQCSANEYIFTPCSDFSDTVCKPCRICEKNQIMVKACNSKIPYGNTECTIPSPIDEIIQSYLESLKFIDEQSSPVTIAFFFMIITCCLFMLFYIHTRIRMYHQQIHDYIVRKAIVAKEQFIDHSVSLKSTENRTDTTLTDSVRTVGTESGSSTSSKQIIPENYSEYSNDKSQSYNGSSSLSDPRTNTSASFSSMSQYSSTIVGTLSRSSTSSVGTKESIIVPSKEKQLSKVMTFSYVLYYILVKDKSVWMLFNILSTILQFLCTIGWLVLIPWACMIPSETTIYYNAIANTNAYIGGTTMTCIARNMGIVMLLLSCGIGCIGTPIFLRYFRQQGAGKLFGEVNQKQRIWFSSMILVNILSLRNTALWIYLDRLLDKDVIIIGPQTTQNKATSSTALSNKQLSSSSNNGIYGGDITNTNSVYQHSSTSTKVNKHTISIPHWMIENRRKPTIIIAYISLFTFFIDSLHGICVIFALSHPVVQISYVSILLVMDGLLTAIFILFSFIEYIPILLCGKYYFSSNIAPFTRGEERLKTKHVTSGILNYDSKGKTNIMNDKMNDADDIIPYLPKINSASNPTITSPIILKNTTNNQNNRFLNMKNTFVKEWRNGYGKTINNEYENQHRNIDIHKLTSLDNYGNYSDGTGNEIELVNHDSFINPVSISTHVVNPTNVETRNYPIYENIISTDLGHTLDTISQESLMDTEDTGSYTSKLSQQGLKRTSSGVSLGSSSTSSNNNPNRNVIDHYNDNNRNMNYNDSMYRTINSKFSVPIVPSQTITLSPLVNAPVHGTNNLYINHPHHMLDRTESVVYNPQPKATLSQISLSGSSMRTNDGVQNSRINTEVSDDQSYVTNVSITRVSNNTEEVNNNNYNSPYNAFLLTTTSLSIPTSTDRKSYLSDNHSLSITYGTEIINEDDI